MPPPSAAPVPQLRDPASILELVNYQLHLIGAMSSSVVTRICEGEFGITRREWRFLALLAAHGALSPSELAERAVLDRSRTSKALMPLVEKGLVERHSVQGDRRWATVTLTEQGRALYDKLFPRAVAVNIALLDVLQEDECQQLGAIMAKLKTRAAQLATSEFPGAMADRKHGGSRVVWRSQARGSDLP